MIEILKICECALKNRSIYHLESIGSVDQMIQEYKVVLFHISKEHKYPDIRLTNTVSGNIICFDINFNPYLWFVNFYDAKRALRFIIKKVEKKCWLTMTPTT